MKAEVEQLPPHSIEAEESALGSFLLDPTCIVIVSPFLRPDDFYREKNGAIYAAMLDIYNAGSQIDVVTLCDRLNRGGKMAEVGGAGYISTLMNAVPTAAHVEHYAKIVQEKARLRRLIALGVQVLRDAYHADAESGRVWESAKKQLDAALSEQATDSVLEHKASLVSYLGTLGEREAEAASGKTPLTMPWEDVAKYVPMLRNGSLMSVAAQSGVGKTVFMENLAEHWAQNGFNVLFFHLELSHETMLDRRMARWSGVRIEDLWRGVNDSSVAQATAEMDAWAGRLTYIHCPDWTMRRIALKARELASKRDVHAIIVDYLQKAAYDEKVKGMNTAQLRGQDVETLKSLGEQMGNVVVLGTQLSRQNEIRDTGEMLEKCNVSIRLERPLLDEGAVGGTVVHTGERGPVVTVTVDKYTLGKTGKAELLLVGPRFTMTKRERGM